MDWWSLNTHTDFLGDGFGLVAENEVVWVRVPGTWEVCSPALATGVWSFVTLILVSYRPRVGKGLSDFDVSFSALSA